MSVFRFRAAQPPKMVLSATVSLEICYENKNQSRDCGCVTNWGWGTKPTEITALVDCHYQCDKAIRSQPSDRGSSDPIHFASLRGPTAVSGEILRMHLRHFSWTSTPARPLSKYFNGSVLRCPARATSFFFRFCDFPILLDFMAPDRSKSRCAVFWWDLNMTAVRASVCVFVWIVRQIKSVIFSSQPELESEPEGIAARLLSKWNLF